MKIYVLTFTDVQTNKKQVEVYPTLKLAQTQMRGKVDDAIATSNTLDLIVEENKYWFYVKDVCELTIDEVEMNWHDFIAHKIVEHYCEKVVEANVYYDVIYDIVKDYNTENYPNMDDCDDIDRFINYKLLNSMSFLAAKKMTIGIGISYGNSRKVAGYLYDNVDICNLAKIINEEKKAITEYQIQYDIDHPNEPLFNHKKVWAFSSKLFGGAHFLPDYSFRLFENREDAEDALISKKNDIKKDFIHYYDEDELTILSVKKSNSTEYIICEKENNDDVWEGKVEVRYIE